MIQRSWMKLPITCASKLGFVSKSAWDSVARAKPSWSNERWRILQTSGLFGRSLRYLRMDHVLVLTETGKRVARQMNLDPVEPPNADFLYHDGLVMEYVLKLESQDLIQSWVSEIELKRKYFKHSRESRGEQKKPKYPDLIVRLKVPGNPVYFAVEIENSWKNSHRYNEFTNMYKRQAQIDSVLVICKTQKIIDAIRRAQVRTLYPQNVRPMTFGIIEEVIASPGIGKMFLNDKPIRLESIVKSLREKCENTVGQEAS